MARSKKIAPGTMARKKSLPRRMLRLFMWLLLSSLLLLGATLLWLHTDSGRDFARDKIEAGATDALPGSLAIGKLEGSLLGDPTLRDISLSDPAGDPVLHIARLDLGLSLGALLSGSLDIDTLQVDGLHLDLRQKSEGQLNLLASLIDPNADESKEPMPLHLRGITIKNSSLKYTDPEGQEIRLDNLSLRELQLESSQNTTSIVIDELAADLSLCAGQRVTVSGAFAISEQGFTCPELRVAIGESTITLSKVEVASDASELHADLNATLGPELLRCLSPDTRWLRPISIAGEVHKQSADEQLRFSLKVDEGALEVTEGRLSSDFKSGGATITMRKLVLSQYVDLGKEVRATGNFTLDAASLDPENLKASLVGAGTGHVDGFDFRLLELSLKNEGKRATIALGLSGEGAALESGMTVNWEAEPLVLSDGRLALDIPKLDALPVEVPLTGSLKIEDTTFAGPVDSLQVKGMLVGERLRFEKNRARSIHLEVDLKRATASPKGEVKLRAAGIGVGRTAVGPLTAKLTTDGDGKVALLTMQGGRASQLWVSLKAKLSQKGTSHQALLQSLQLRHRTLRAKLRSSNRQTATLTRYRDGTINVSDLKLALAGGSVAISGRSDDKFTAKLRGLDLGDLLALGPPLPIAPEAKLKGQVTATPVARGLDIKVEVGSEKLSLSEDGEPLRVKATGRMAPGVLESGIEVHSQASGSMRFALKARPPRGPWQRASAALVRTATLSFDDFDLTILHPLHPELASLGGSLQGKLSVGSGARRIDGELSAMQLVHKSWTSERALRLNVDATQKNASLAVTLNDSKIGEARLNLGLRPPGPLHSPWRWKPKLDSILRDSDLVLESIDLVALQEAVPGLADKAGIESGTVKGRIEFREADKKFLIGMQLEKFSANGQPHLEASVDAEVDPKTSSLRWQVAADPKNRIQGEVSLAAGLSLLRLRHNMDRLMGRLERAKFKATVTGASNSPKLWAGFAGQDDSLPLSGRVTLGGKFSGSLLKPGGDFQINVAGAEIDGISLRQLSLITRVKDGVADAQLSIWQSQKRRATVKLLYDLEKSAMREGSLTASDIDLRILRALDKEGDGILSSIAGVANGSFVVTGPWESLRPSGTMKIRNGAIDLGGSLLPIVNMALEIEAEGKKLTLVGKAKSGSGRIKLVGQAKVDRTGIKDIAVRIRTTQIPVVLASLVCSVDLDAHSQIALKGGNVDIKTKIDSALVRVPIRSFLAETRSLHSLDGMSDVVYLSPEEEGSDKSDNSDKSLDVSGSKVRIRIRANDSVVVRTGELLARVALDLDTTLVDNKVVIDGRAEVSSGHIDLFERRYTIEKASANFRRRVPTNPSFDLRLRHEFDLLTLTILGRGSVDDPKISFLADPADYDESTLLAIVLGQAPALTEEQQGLRDNALSAVSTYAAGKIQELLAPILPFDLDVLRADKTDNGGYLYVTGKWITDDWFVAYNHRTLAEESENTDEAESKYRLSKAWALEGVAGESEGGLDILWTKRWGK